MLIVMLRLITKHVMNTSSINNTNNNDDDNNNNGQTKYNQQ